MLRNFKRLFLLIVLFIFIFGWKVTFVFDLILFCSLIVSFYVFLVLRSHIDRKAFFFTGLLYVLSTYSLGIATINGGMDLYFGLRSIRATINFLGGVAIVYLYYMCYQNKFWKKLIEHLYLVLVLHSILIVAMYFNESLRSFVYSITHATNYVNLNSPFLSGLRISGLTYGLSQTSVVQMFGLLIFPYLVSNSSLTRSIIVLFGAILIFLSLFLTGRSGLALLPILWTLMLFLKFFRNRRNLKFKRSSFFNIGKVSVLIFLLVFSLGYMREVLPEKFDYNVKRASEVTELFVNRGETPTIDTLKTMYFLPDDISVVFFGSSNSGRGAMGRINSDVGYVLSIYAIGIFGVVLMVFIYMYGLISSFRIRHCNYTMYVLTFCVLLSAIILNFKEVALFTRNQWSVQSLLIASVFLIQKLNKKNRKEKMLL